MYFMYKHTNKEFVKSRTTKLLVPSTIGLFVFQFIQGYVSMHLADGAADLKAAHSSDGQYLESVRRKKNDHRSIGEY